MLIKNEPLAKHNSWRTGGIARYFFMPESLDALQQFLKKNNQPIVYLGLGSNVLVSDKGFDGVVICTKKLKQIQINETTIDAQAGAGLAQIARLTKDNQSLAFFAGIPGTVGGALAMNAGAFGYQTWDFVNTCQTIDNKGVIYKRYRQDFDIAYRHVKHHYQNEYFLSAQFQSNQASKDNITALLKKRNDSQPIGLASCGCVFKNPTGHYAAELIESLGLKGYCIGGACVSNKHANFIINEKNATSTAIKTLITYIQEKVKAHYNIDLETEVRWIE